MTREQGAKTIAHIRSTDGAEQALEDHLYGVGEIAGKLSNKLGIREAGVLIGLLHDFGKYSKSFQNYIKSAEGKLNPDEDDYVNAKGLKGKIDHSTAGAQYVWQAFKNIGRKGEGELCGQVLALCIASHHSGLIDCLSPDPDDGNKFRKRMKKEDEKTNLNECKENADKTLKRKIDSLATKDLIKVFCEKTGKAIDVADTENPKKSPLIKDFYLGLWARFLFSCLIDADRVNSADFENPDQAQFRYRTPDWNHAIERFEKHIKTLKIRNKVDEIRNKISRDCFERARDPQGIYTLTVPTGGGKTFSSLRFALHHAEKHNLEHIFYIIPFTSIIEQNAGEVRSILEKQNDPHPWVLEHHSNLEPENQTWGSKLSAENWDAPIIFTTMVQFLEALFSGGTRSARRFHQFANSVIVFDEIQSLPINCVHIFCNSINFLSDNTNTTVLLCTATQPLLHKLKKPEKGQINLKEGNHELTRDKSRLFHDLERVRILYEHKQEGWNVREIAELAISELERTGNCLVIVNTKKWARDLYVECEGQLNDGELYHLSTNLCASHRKDILKNIKIRLNPGNKSPVLCISTQLIEAGVDIDFASVIRFTAGLDSIAQAAGRCNRNGIQTFGTVTIINPVNPDKESIKQLVDIKEGIRNSKKIFSEFRKEEKSMDKLLTPEAMKEYFDYYFHARSDDMVYKIDKKVFGRDDSLLNLLSSNCLNGCHEKRDRKWPLLQQSFMTAGKAFKAIDAPTESVIVPYGEEGKDIINHLLSIEKEYDLSRYYELLRKAQGFSVNVFPNTWKKLAESEAVFPIQDEQIYYLDECHYHPQFGLSLDEVASYDINVY